MARMTSVKYPELDKNDHITPMKRLPKKINPDTISRTPLHQIRTAQDHLASSLASPSKPYTSSTASPKRYVHPYAKTFIGLPILTTEHSPQNVALYASFLGIIVGFAFGARWTGGLSNALSGYFGFAAIGMVCEYITRAILRQEKGLKSFCLVEGSQKENILLYVGPLEWGIRTLLFPSASYVPAITSAGIVCAIIAQNVRTFSVLGLCTDPRDKSTVHRSRIALSIWRIALQLIMCNPVCFVLQCLKNERASSPVARLIKPPEPGLGPFGLPIFDGLHTPQNIAAYAYLLGCVCGFGLSIALWAPSMRSFGFYLAALASFHTLEYLCTAMYRGDVKLSSFLINHSSAYHAAMAAGFLEYLIEYLYFPNLKQWRWWSWIVLLGLIAAQCLRSAAMVTAGSNFTHIISESKEHAHELVTRGVYSVFRHPSYTAFFYWGIFAQILLANPICAVAYGIALQQFFQDRIPYEEMKLMEFFEDYEIYRQRTKTYIPFVG